MTHTETKEGMVLSFDGFAALVKDNGEVILKDESGSRIVVKSMQFVEIAAVRFNVMNG